MPRLTKAQRDAQLQRDARNRALRTFLQGLGIDVLCAVALLVYDALNDDQPNYRLLALTAAKTAVQTVAAYLMRLKLDPSKVPTPLPPDPPGEPDADAGHLSVDMALALVIVTGAGTFLGGLVLHLVLT